MNFRFQWFDWSYGSAAPFGSARHSSSSKVGVGPPTSVARGSPPVPSRRNVEKGRPRTHAGGQVAVSLTPPRTPLHERFTHAAVGPEERHEPPLKGRVPAWLLAGRPESNKLAVTMETHGERQQRQQAPANESAASGPGPAPARPLAINSMSPYERQAVQALQALQGQPRAAHYFQQLMLQQRINKTQLHNMAAVQRVKAGATSDSASSAGSRPVTAATISQSLLLSGGAGGRGQMFLRVNRSLRAPISSQLIFMPGGAPGGATVTTASVATVTVATVARPPKEEMAATTSSGGQTDGELNLAVRGVSFPKSLKTEALEKCNAASSSLVASLTKSTQPLPSPIKIPTYPHPAHLKANPSPVVSTPSLPFSQLLLHGTRTLTAGTATNALVLASAAASQARVHPLNVGAAEPAAGGAQTLVVQPLQKSAPGGDKVTHPNGPVPIQPKTLQGLRLPLRLPPKTPPPILPALSPAGRPPRTPHVPVQFVGARQSALGSGQALALPRGGFNQELAAVCTSSSSRHTVGASVTSGEGGVPVTSQAHLHPGARQNESMVPASTLPLAQEAQSGTPGVATNSDPTGNPSGQSKDAALKRKMESSCDFIPEVRQPPALRDDASTLPDSDADVSAAPPASPLASASRGVCGVGERAPPPQAVVKPHVLTHVIEGFVIQEGARPFPVCGQTKDPTGEDLAPSVATATMMTCEYCEESGPASRFPGAKRFCSTLCAKRFKLAFARRPSWERQSPLSDSEEECGAARRRTRRRKVPRRTSSEIASAKIAGQSLSAKRHSESSRSESEWSGEDEDDDAAASLWPASSSAPGLRRTPPPSPPPPAPVQKTSAAPSSPARWTVDQVSQFICSLQGCEDLASLFWSQEIDGQALMLLKEEHLVSAMNIKLGPALKICAHINNLKE
ncbi:polyhomeotic-like protein 1 isoform X2 [Syngnathoides biaculeatus]|uniref:polyhomeotic-like protein 1 isoform X2 n=1 Tax=Syngnathoides biaculeatus TaxID=300417 RepID=UPI002ADD730A|nr:polyhomeotic-like protein 1 isoform X2 [Syngnathoides biaculeatus]